MEAASFSIFDAAALKFQLSEPDVYYVHHMSMFEHLIHKKYGFQIAQNKTLIMSTAAFQGECVARLAISNTTSYIALIPFYGGLPPNVTADYSKVKSLGQGNSLVDASTKALQAMASVCSALNYFGHVIVGVTRDEDLKIILATLDQVNPLIKSHVDVIQYRMSKPAHLPFHMLAWGQLYVQNNNCKNVFLSREKSSVASIASSLISTIFGGNSNSSSAAAASKRSRRRLDITGHHRVEKHPNTKDDGRNPYTICSENFHKKHHGKPITVAYHRPASHFVGVHNESADLNFDPVGLSVRHPIHFVYYTECDQIVRFDSLASFAAISDASNDTTFLTGRRREKILTSDPEDYMGALDSWRNCGIPGYSLTWPKDKVVRID